MTVRPTNLPPLPTFPSSEASQSGLHLLASVVSSAGQLGDSPGNPNALSTQTQPSLHQTSLPSNLHQPGPYNPASTLPPKVVKKILNLEFVEMSEIAADEFPTPNLGQPPTPSRPPIHDISIWMEKFAVMAAILAARFPEKSPELFAYLAAIVRAERNFDNQCWVAYDRCYRREALGQKDLNWSIPNIRLYNEAFTGRARAIPRCAHCLQEDHVARYCPLNPNRVWLDWSAPSPATYGQGQGRPQPYQVPEHCRRFNAGKCKLTAATCRFSHRCGECNGPHPKFQCPRTGQRARMRSWSPSQTARQALPPPPPQAGPHY